jgi:polyisoprenoid-binding protein YceI
MPSEKIVDQTAGEITLHTGRQGVGSAVGHDLTLRVGAWSATAQLDQQGRATGVRVVAQLASLEVVRGDGGLKPLSDKDRRTILDNALRTLKATQHPELVFEATGLALGEGRTRVEGTVSLAGSSAPQTVDVVVSAASLTATAEVVQTAFGIKPYSGMLGALKVRDAVEVRATVDLG